MNKLVEFYYNRQLLFESKEKKITQHIYRLSFFRLFVFLLLLFGIFYVYKITHTVSMITTVGCIIAFLFLLKKTSKLRHTKKKYQTLVTINKNEINALKGDYSAFSNGEEFIETSHPYSYDLDLFGRDSIFQVINRTATTKGKKKLAQRMCVYSCDGNVIKENQDAILELENKLEWRQGFQSIGLYINEHENDYNEIQNWLKEPAILLSKKFYKVISTVLPTITLIIIILASFHLISSGFAVLLMLFQLGVVAVNLKYINKKTSSVSKNLSTLKKYTDLLKLIEEENFTSNYLQGLKKQIKINNSSPSKEFQQLTKIINALDNRNNVLLALILDGVFLWDINYILKLEKWMQKFKDNFEEWIDVIAEFEAISSLACFKYNNPEFCMPEISKEEFLFHAKEMSHPLIKVDERITNNYSQQGLTNIVLVTGANMAGKSTFLRTIGVNLILAMLGTCVCARKLIVTPIMLRTSMRNNDSLQKHTSYFFAELKRLKQIINNIKNGEKVFILLDEILKGTNSKDQHMGSSRLIINLLKLHSVGIIATHDIELTKLEEQFPRKIKNIAFEIDIVENSMVFNYKYKDGICQKMNATHLMEQMEIF